jgi:hypothetical protein
MGTALIPVIEDAIFWLTELGKVIQGNTKEFYAFSAGIHEWVAAMLTALDYLMIWQKVLGTITDMPALGDASEQAWKYAALMWERANDALREYQAGQHGAGEEIPGILGAWQDPYADLISKVNSLASVREKIQAEINKLHGIDPLKKLIEDAELLGTGLVGDQLEIFKNHLREIGTLYGKLGEAREKSLLSKAAQSIWEQTRTPLEKYEIEIGKLHNLLEKGEILWDTYSRAVRMAREELERATSGTSRMMSTEFKEIRAALVSVPGLSKGTEVADRQLVELKEQTEIAKASKGLLQTLANQESLR